MKKLLLIGVVLAFAAVEGYALTGPADGGYIWVTSLRRPGTEYYDIWFEALSLIHI